MDLKSFAVASFILILLGVFSFPPAAVYIYAFLSYTGEVLGV